MRLVTAPPPGRYTADQVASRIEAARLREVCRLVRRARGSERDDQAVLLARAGRA
jgi:hypothetical protein